MSTADISKIDKNFAGEEIHNEAAKMNSNIKTLYTHTSGGRLRFCTDSTRIFLRSVLPTITKFDHIRILR